MADSIAKYVDMSQYDHKLTHIERKRSTERLRNKCIEYQK